MRRCPSCARELADDVRFCPFDGTSVATAEGGPRDPLVGTLVAGRYRVLQRIGSGGFATVYLAQHQVLGRSLALKVLHPSLAGEDAVVARFAREARAAARIDHENVVYVFDFGDFEPGGYFIAMEHVAGTALELEVQRAGPLEPSRAAHIFAQVAAAVGRAHELGIVHRDLKPGNVLLMQRGSDRDFVKVVDFGLAGPLQGGDLPALTRAGDLFGTPEYMAPEQWNGTPTDERTDIYALGVLLYETLTGEVPYRGGPVQQMAGHLHQQPRPPTELVPAIPPILEEIVLRALEKNPRDRWPNAAAVLEALGLLWREVRPERTSVTYSRTPAAPPRPSPEVIPDATVYQSRQVDVVWDGPSLCEEIGRLHALRARRGTELTSVLWGGRPPPEYQRLSRLVEADEAEVEAIGHEVALLRAEAEESSARTREREAALRVEVIDARLAMLGAGQESDDRLGRAERRLASHLRTVQHAGVEIDARIAERLSRLRDLERKLAPVYEDLSKLVRKAAERRPEVRPAMIEFGRIDGALVAYQGLLDALDAD